MIPNLTDYADKKAKKLITIQSLDKNDFAIGEKKFDPDDGTELSQQVSGVSTKEVDDKIAELQAEIDELKSFKADLTAAI